MVYKTLRNIVPFVGVPAAIIALITIGPCSTKEYVVVTVQSAKAAAVKDLDDHRQADKEFRQDIRDELRIIRQDIKVLLDRGKP